jgi:hypothetical protein
MTGPIHYRPAGPHHPRQGRWVVLVAFWTVMGLLCVTGLLVALLREPSTPASPCPPPQSCPGPKPVLPPSSTGTWTSAGHTVSLQYPSAVFAVDQRGATTLQLRVRSARPSGVDASVWITARPLSDGSPAELLHQRTSQLSASILGLTEDQDSRTVIPPPHIGDIAGVGGSYRGTVDTPQGPGGPVVAILGAASDGHTTTVVSYVITGTDNAAEIQTLRGYLSPLLTSFTWGRP